MLTKYRNGNYDVFILENGTKYRFCKDDTLLPERPESIDVQITTVCKQNCSFCYANCSVSGKHSELFDNDGNPVKWLASVKPGTELAINGNDMNHPDLYRFLQYCKEHHIIVNMTVHQQQFIDNYVKIHNYQKDKLLYGIGVSINSSIDQTLIRLIQNTPNAICHVIAGNFNYIEYNKITKHNLKLLVLGYKNKGRGASYKDKFDDIITFNNNWLSTNIMDIKNDFHAVMFDCLAVEQLNMKDYISKEEWDTLYMGADGTTTFYIDAVNKTFAKSSTETEYKDISDMTVEEMFNYIRNCNE